MSRSCKECAHHNPDFIDEVCLHCSWPEFAGEPSNFKPKPITNYDRIVSKSPGELAEWLAEVLFHCSNTICDQRCPMYECCCDQPSDNIEDWLKQEAKI